MKPLLMQSDFYNKLKDQSTVQTKQTVDSSDMPLGVVGDCAAAGQYIDNYGNLIWSMAKKFTDSNEDAEAVTREIFLNIWRYAARFEETDFDELLFVTIIACHQLRKYTEKLYSNIN
jgi:DNA-directed RNA polymerase specialized sigma24 family protein